jgi:hypothetical protein
MQNEVVFWHCPTEISAAGVQFPTEVHVHSILFVDAHSCELHCQMSDIRLFYKFQFLKRSVTFYKRLVQKALHLAKVNWNAQAVPS